MKHFIWICAAMILTLYSCTGIMAGSVADQVVENTLAIQAYDGTYYESYGKSSLEKTVSRIQYKKPWKTRTEIVSPKSMKGDLFIFDGSTMTMWWPGHLFGIRVSGITPQEKRVIRKIVQQDISRAWENTLFSLQGPIRSQDESPRGGKPRHTKKSLISSHMNPGPTTDSPLP